MLRVPTPFRPALSHLARIPEADYSALSSALSAEPVDRSHDGLLRAIQARLRGDSPADALQLLEALTAYSNVRAFNEMTVDTVADAVAWSDDLELSEGERKELRSRLLALLNSPTLQTIGKASDLEDQFPYRFRRARIFTDMRPIFADNPEGGPLGTVVMHNLKLEFLNDREGYDSLFVALTDAELESLSGVLQRARQKGNTLHDFLRRVGLERIVPRGIE